MKIKKRLSALILILFIFNLTGCSQRTTASNMSPKIKSGKDINFFITSDIHYLAKDLTDGGEAFQEFINSGDGKLLNYVEEITNAFTYDIKKKKPDILILSGDLTNNGEKKSHLELAKKLSDIEKSGTSVYVVPGNHDILNPYARGFKGDDQYKVDYISDKDFSKIYADFGFKEAISKDKNTLSYLAAPSEDVWLLMLDTAQYRNNIKNNAPQVDGRISPETYQWIKKCSDLAKEKGAQIITVMHHNLMNHSDVIRNGFTLNDNNIALEKFQSFGLNLALSGHIHIQDINSYKKDDYTVYDIVSSSLSVYPQQYGVLKYSPSNGFDYNTCQIDMEGWAKEAGITDKNITNFKEYSKSSFGDRGYAMAYYDLIGTKYTEEEKDLMAETMRTLNLNYFAGTENINSEEIIKSKGFKLWLNDDPTFLQRYAVSISRDNNLDDNKLHITKASETVKH